MDLIRKNVFFENTKTKHKCADLLFIKFDSEELNMTQVLKCHKSFSKDIEIRFKH